MAFDPLYIASGDLRHSVIIQAPNTSERDAAGQATTNWTTILTTRAKVESTGSLSYRMSFAGSEQSSSSTDVMTLRWPGKAITLEAGQRVLLGANVWSIQAVDNVQHRNRIVRLACLQVDADSN